jgi:hypothetical protein
MSYNFKLSTACVSSALTCWLLATTATVSAPPPPSDEQYALIGIVPLAAFAGEDARLCQKNDKDPDGCGPASQQLLSIDIAWVDPGSHTYALADRSNKSVDVIDTRENDVARLLTAVPPFAGVQAKGFSGPSGVVIVEHKEVWASDGPTPGCGPSPSPKCLGSFKVIDLESGDTIKTIPALKCVDSKCDKFDAAPHGAVDEICYNPSSDVVLGASHAGAPFNDKFLTFVSEDTYHVIGTITLDGTDTEHAYAKGIKPVNALNGIEQCQPSKDGKFFYLAVPDIGGGKNGVDGSTGHDGAVLKISGHKPFKVENVFPIKAKTGCLGPAGLVIGPAHQIGLGCQTGNGGQNSLIIDDRDGSTIQIVAGEGGTDEAWYDPGSNHYFFGRAAVGLMGVEDAGPPPKADAGPPPAPNLDVKTAVGSKNPAVDPHKNNVYVPILGGASTICSSKGGDDKKGCIAIYHARNDKDDCVAEGDAVIEVDEDGDAKHRKVRCDRD